MKKKKSIIFPLVIFFTTIFSITFSDIKKSSASPSELIYKSEKSLKNFLSDQSYSRLHNLIKDAQAIIIFPNMLKGGFFLGIEGGNGVLIIKENQEWTSPLFFTMGSVSFGFQIGVTDAEVLLAIMTKRGLQTILDHRVKLGADVSVSTGPVGFGAEVATTIKLADIYSFSRGRGLYAGISVEGSYIHPNEDLNQQYYGKNIDVGGQSSYKKLLETGSDNFNKILGNR